MLVCVDVDIGLEEDLLVLVLVLVVDADVNVEVVFAELLQSATKGQRRSWSNHFVTFVLTFLVALLPIPLCLPP